MSARIRKGAAGRRSGQRAYTAVEVLLALTVLLISMAGVMSMQRAAIQGNVDARKLDIANAVARTWLDRLSTDGATWNGSSGLTGTVWLKDLIDKGYLPPAVVNPNASVLWSPAFDIFGRDIAVTDSTTIFCTHVKVDTVANFVTPGAGVAATPVLLRVTVLVFWGKSLTGTAAAGAAPICGVGAPADVAAAEAATPGLYHMLFATEAIRRGS